MAGIIEEIAGLNEEQIREYDWPRVNSARDCRDYDFFKNRVVDSEDVERRLTQVTRRLYRVL